MSKNFKNLRRLGKISKHSTKTAITREIMINVNIWKLSINSENKSIPKER